MVSFCIYKMDSTDSSPIYGASAVRVFVLLFSFSVFSDQRTLKIENEIHNAEIRPQKSHIWGLRDQRTSSNQVG